MKRHRGLLAISVLPALTMLGSLILMNDHNSASRRGMLSVFLLYFALAQLILFSFFIGYLPKTNQKQSNPHRYYAVVVLRYRL